MSHNNNDNNNNSRMGDLFQQRRGGGGNSHNNNNNHHNNRNRQQHRGGGRNRGRANQYNDLPIEQGVVCSLKESFGFIHCADRPDEVFFHYSQLNGMNPIDLQMDDEVEFRVGPSQRDADKLAAFQVHRLTAGTIVWETVEKEKVRGHIERAVPRQDRDGTIRVQNDDGDSNTNKSEDGPSPKTTNASRTIVRFGPNDYQPSDRAHLRLSRGDLVEFTIVKDRRTKDLFARSIVMVKTEKELAEEKLLAEATEEVGVITSLKGDYGFLRSNSRREEVYFHYSSINLDETEHGDDETERSERLVLGQDMKFLVVTEGQNDNEGGGGGAKARRRVSARRVSLQPRGSVKFHDVIARGVTGKVTLVPQPQDSGHALETQGRVRLDTPIRDIVPDADGNDKMVTEVYLHCKDSPGGSFAFRGGSSVGLWIEIGDTLLFDVVKDFADGACRAIPTIFTDPCENPTDVANNGGEVEEEDGEGRAVRLVKLSLISRSEGTVNALKDSYGFIHFAERPVDVHFKLFQLLPEDIQMDLRRFMGVKNVDHRGNPLKVNLNAEVQFDISVHGSIQSHSTQKRGSRHERENLKAQRVLLLPPGTIQQQKELATKVRAVVSKDNPKQPYSGEVIFDEEIKPMTLLERHPLVAQMITDFMNSEEEQDLVFHDIQSSKEDDVVVQIIEAVAKDQIIWTHIPVAGETHYPGRLRLKKKGDNDDEEPAVVTPIADGHVSDDDIGTDDEGYMSTGSMDTSDGGGKKRSARRRKQRSLKPFKALRFDKSSLTKQLKEDSPPVVGEVVEVNVIQSRRTGQFHAENLKFLERKVASNAGSSGMGFVKEIVANKKFGFIAVIDDAAEKLEQLFFNLTSVADASTKLKRGDEVKFDIKTEKSGKRVALHIALLPHGTLPSKAESNACSGLVLMEPTHTTLSNTPQRNLTPPRARSKPGSRWESVDEDLKQKPATAAPIQEKGCLLLTNDPSGMFAADSTDTNIQHLRYQNGAIAVFGAGASNSEDEKSKPRRGDLVTFVKTKKGTGQVRDIRLVTRGAATMVRGNLKGIADGSATFVATDGGKEYKVALTEIVSCEPTVLKEDEAVEGILHQDAVYGICRTVDLYLETKIMAPTKSKGRPKLNLTVKKDRGGTIMAQSMMAKGPDEEGNGFAPGWTKRMSAFVTPFVPGG